MSIDSGAEHFAVGGVPGGELAGGDAALGHVEEDEEPVPAFDEPGILERLTVTDTNAEASDVSVLHFQVGPYPMNILWCNPEAAS